MLNATLQSLQTGPIAHRSVWRASELARGGDRTIATGYSALSNALPGGGWPAGQLIELLLAQAGIGELRLLRPALAALGTATIALLQPQHMPNAPAWTAMGLPASQLLWLRAHKDGDALWAAEQILRSGSCGALLFWLPHARGTALRRLHLAAQYGQTLFCALRPLACADQPSPAALRLSLRPAPGGIEIGFVKRRGPRREAALFLPLQPSPLSLYRHASVDRPAFTPAAAGSVLSGLAG